MTRTLTPAAPSRAFRLDPPDPVFNKQADRESISVAFRLPQKQQRPKASPVRAAGFPPCESIEDFCVLTGTLAFLLDGEGTILKCSANVADGLGYSPEACNDVRFSALSWRGEEGCGAETLRSELFLRKLRETGHVSEFELALADRFGLKRPFRARGVVYFEDTTDPQSLRLLVTGMVFTAES